MKGRRIPVVPGADPYDHVVRPGDYYGPVMGFSGDVPAVFFLLPITVDDRGQKHGLHHVCHPPHTFTENADGTLTITASILSKRRDGSEIWHGHLEDGVWRKA